MTELDRQKKYALQTRILILVAASFVLLLMLVRDFYDYALWQANINDPGRRWKPHQREDINSDGLRSYEEATDFNSGDFNIIFIGDSFAFGHQLAIEQSPPMQFQSLSLTRLPDKKIHVINFSWSGSSPYLALNLLKEKAAGYKPKLVILMLDVTDFKDDYFYQHIADKTGFYGFMVDHPLLAFYPRKFLAAADQYTGWHKSVMGYPDQGNYFLLHQPYEKSLPFFENTNRNLYELNNYVVHGLNAKFIVFIPPRHWQYTDKESPQSWERHNYEVMGPHVLNNFIYFQQKLPTAPFPIIPLLDDFRNSTVFPTTFKKDSHWNPQGATFAAELMLNHCLQLKCFD